MTLADPRKVLADIDGEKKAKEESDLPAIAKIPLDIVGTRGKHYKHTFVYKVPTLGDQVKMAQIKAQYLPLGAAADPNGYTLVEQIAYLTVTLDPNHLPDWWDVWSLYDATPISALYQEVTSYEKRFHGLQASDNHGGEGEELAGAGRPDGRGSDEEGDAALGEEAQAPAQRRKVIASTTR